VRRFGFHVRQEIGAHALHPRVLIHPAVRAQGARHGAARRVGRAAAAAVALAALAAAAPPQAAAARRRAARIGQAQRRRRDRAGGRRQRGPVDRRTGPG